MTYSTRRWNLLFELPVINKFKICGQDWSRLWSRQFVRKSATECLTVHVAWVVELEAFLWYTTTNYYYYYSTTRLVAKFQHLCLLGWIKTLRLIDTVDSQPSLSSASSVYYNYWIILKWWLFDLIIFRLWSSALSSLAVPVEGRHEPFRCSIRCWQSVG